MRYSSRMWANVIGQSRVKRIIANAIESGKLPGAYLFSGPEGVGKDAAALELAKALNCINPTESGACDECESCVGIQSLASNTVHFLHALPKKESSGDEEVDLKDIDVIREQLAAKSADPYHNLEIPRATAIQIAQIRELRTALSRSFTGGQKRVVIISEADMMNVQSQNAFLKTLEEPHANTLIILTSSNAHRLLPTIHSRCQDVRFDALAAEEIARALIEREELPHEEAEFLSRLANGSYSGARAMIGEDVKEMRNQIVDFLRMGLSKSRLRAAQQIDLFLPRSGGGKFLERRQATEQRLALLALWLRDALALTTKAEAQIVNLDQMDALVRFVGRFGDPRGIVLALAAVDRAMHLVRLQLQLRPVMMQLVVELEEALVTIG
ncbi:MAG: AAA family ATPase [Bacteroidota bacterium]|nr:AAA family ATPase [Bacteroidota bacterium]MDP4232024.1 AAA family ATPase [Bacteroidota bacterium]MDP4241269.1 AAA family ATPase [Bacteroidota bacterium]MDP4286661.1 AAA family ATPase [Bacteroidota bacterium]